MVSNASFFFAFCSSCWSASYDPYREHRSLDTISLVLRRTWQIHTGRNWLMHQIRTCYTAHMPCVTRFDKGSVASVTRSKRPRAGSSHGMSLITALSSSPLSEPSLKELHTGRAPLGLNQETPQNDRACHKRASAVSVTDLWSCLTSRHQTESNQAMWILHGNVDIELPKLHDSPMSLD